MSASFVFGWPQLIILLLFGLGLGTAIAKDGQPRTGHHSFIYALIAVGINMGLLYWGGFFS